MEVVTFVTFSFFYYFDIKIVKHYSPHITAGAAASQTRLQSPTQTPSNYLPTNLTKSQTRARHHTDLIRSVDATLVTAAAEAKCLHSLQ